MSNFWGADQFTAFLSEIEAVLDEVRDIDEEEDSDKDNGDSCTSGCFPII